MKYTEFLSKIAFILTIIIWGLSVIGYLGSTFFASNNLVTDISIMSPRTISQLFFISLIFLATPFLEILSIAAFFISKRNWQILTALSLNAIPIVLMLSSFLIQGGNIPDG